MTIVVGLSSLFDAFVVADCRITYRHGNREVYRDVCQKLVTANAWSTVGFAGDVCMGRHLLRGVVNRLRATRHTDSGWVKADNELLNFVAQGVSNHIHLGPLHARCQRAKARLLIAWLDYDRPDPISKIVVVETPEMRVRRTGRGLDFIGSGGRIAQAMRDEAFSMLANFGQYADDQEHMEAHRALIATRVIRDLLADKGGDRYVGGLFEVATISKRGVGTVPYFYLADVEPGFRTYVAMRPENGEYVQEHRPTGRAVKIGSPFDIDPFAAPGQHEMFDPMRMLTRHSPGVIRVKPLELAFSLYDSSQVPDEFRESWGDEPLPPATWGTPAWLADEE